MSSAPRTGPLASTRRGQPRVSPASRSRELDRGETPKGLIDVHTHSTLRAWERAYDASGRSRNANGRPAIGPVVLPAWTAEDHLEVMDQHGIRASFLSNPGGCDIAGASAEPETARAMNVEMADIVARYPDRFGAFACLPLNDIAASIDETKHALGDLQLDGICLPTHIGGDYFDNGRFLPLFEEFNRHKATVFVHPISPQFFGQIRLPYWPHLLEGMFENARMLTSLVYSGVRQRFMDFNLISTHAGGVMPYLAQRLRTSADFARGSSFSYSPPIWRQEEVWEGLTSFYFDLTTSTMPTTLGSILELVPSSRLLFGSDFPIRGERWIAPAIVELAHSPFLNKVQRRDVYRETALALFPRLRLAIAAADAANSACS